MGDYFSRKIAAAERLLAFNSLTDWLIAGVVAVGMWFALWLLRNLIAARYHRHSLAEQRLPVRLVAYLYVFESGSGRPRQTAPLPAVEY